MTGLSERSDAHCLVSISDVGQNRRFPFSPPTKETWGQPAAKAFGLHGGITVEKRWGDHGGAVPTVIECSRKIRLFAGYPMT